jgi:hypothetical protein
VACSGRWAAGRGWAVECRGRGQASRRPTVGGASGQGEAAPDIIGLIAQRLNATDDAFFGPVPSWVQLDGMLRSPPSEPD